MKQILFFIFSMVSYHVYSQACKNATLELKLDNFPQESSWEIRSANNVIIASGGTYPGSNSQTLNITVCLYSSQNYTFTMKDSYGDGMCCLYGQGGYKLYYNSTTYASGGQFATSQFHSFCFDCGGGSTPSCTDGIQNGNETGIDCGGSCAACTPTSNCLNATLNLKLDNYPGETRWELRNSGGSVIYSGGPYSVVGQLLNLTVCLTAGQNYSFVIIDSYGDGICCGHGQGYYNIAYNGTTYISGGQFTSTETKNFCFVCGGSGSATCTDGIQNGNETGVDCGGTCLPCQTTTSTYRNIVFLHGLGGASTSWGKMNTLHEKIFGGFVPSWDLRKTDARTFSYSQSSINDASSSALYSTRAAMTDMRGSTYVPTNNQDFLIAHSMGGVVARDMDKKFDQGGQGPKPYGGIITVGTPHGGARAANNLYNGSVNNFINNSCYDILEGPLRDATSLLTRFPFPVSLFPVVANVILPITYHAIDFNQLVCNKLIKDPLSNIPGAAFDLQIGSPVINSLYSAPSVNKIALYGVESEPVLWRNAYSFKRNANTDTYFQADADDNYVTFVNQAISLSNNLKNHYITLAITNPLGAPNSIWRSDGWRRTRNALQNANAKYRTLITGTSTYSFNGGCQLDTYEYGNLSNTQIINGVTLAECEAMTTVYSPYYELIASPIYHYTESTEAYDGVVPVSSAQAFPGATVLDMPGSNHEQMKNDSKLRDKLNLIYDGGAGNFLFWTVAKR